MAANFEAYGIDENTAAQLPIRGGVPSADAAYQCMRIATKTLQNPRARLQGEVYAGVFAVSTLAPNLALANSYVIPTQNTPGRHLPRWGTVPVPVRGALNAGQVAYSADELRALIEVSITYIRIIIQCTGLFRHLRVSTAAELAALHLGFSMKQLKLAAFVCFCLPHNTPDLAPQCYYPSNSRWLNGT